MELGRSFINMIKRSGPRILPWGTPDSTDKRSEQQLLIETNWNLVLRYVCTHQPTIHPPRGSRASSGQHYNGHVPASVDLVLEEGHLGAV